jgi:hypothetical protein
VLELTQGRPAAKLLLLLLLLVLRCSKQQRVYVCCRRPTAAGGDLLQVLLQRLGLTGQPQVNMRTAAAVLGCVGLHQAGAAPRQACIRCLRG